MTDTGRAIVASGLAAGVLDITYASVSSLLRGSSPARMLRAIASGVLGRPALDGGWETSLVGLAFHFAIATGWAALYVLASRRLPVLLARPRLCGPVYGLVVFWLMHLVVLPLSNVPFQVSFTPKFLASGFAAHLFCVGLPIALVARRYLSRSRAATLVASPAEA